MAWIYVLIAGILELGWSVSLKQSQGYTKLWPTVAYALFGLSSAYFLSLSMRILPLAVAYGIWKGIALTGATITDSVYFKEPLSWLRVASVLLILLGVFGLSFSMGDRKPL